ncbi:ComF family protein [Flammeovirga agarivorans]|uniref:ComF family protein n=1 Tax=Flammeovirga agarivorans TaxID=2726742 RepID=A0A7X8SM62_9BACT|nr:phosphoribosyltransferase family protein [Flammeovirga agarivorans]NLR92775.1 ComF family protein [Flammeovirga agarivorans]
MLTLSKVFNSICYTIFPPTCLHCEELLRSGEEYLYFSCYAELPLNNGSWISPQQNNIRDRLDQEVNMATSLFFYTSDNIVQSLIHHLKYKDLPKIGAWMVDHFVFPCDSIYSKSIDLITSIPLHPKKQKQRGYNQLDKFCERLSKRWDVQYDPEVLIRKKHSTSQTKKSKIERLKSLEGVFEINASKRKNIQKKHILIIDDVITTGSTIKSVTYLLKEGGVNDVSILSMSVVF